MQNRKKINKALVRILAFIVVLVLFKGYSYSQIRDFSITTNFPKLVVQREVELKLEVKIKNRGEREEDIYLSVISPSKAKDWDARLTALYGGVDVQAVHLGSKKPDNVLKLEFRATPPKEAPSEEYKFIIKGVTADGKIKRSLEITLIPKGKAWKPKPEEPKSEDIKLLVDYPKIKKPAGEKFEFEIEVENNTPEDLVFDLIPSAPPGWSGYITPRWEDEMIQALKVKKRSSEFIKFVLTPPLYVSEGEYPAKFKVQAKDLVQSIDLKAIVTGTYELRMATKTGRLNVEAIAGKKEIFPIYLWNEGSAPINDVSLFSKEPEGWKVSFDPAKIPSLPPVRNVGKPEKIMVTLEPKPRAIPGDYLVTLTASGMQDREDMRIRVTVKVPATWGWIGVAIIVVAIGILTGIFIRLKRR